MEETEKIGNISCLMLRISFCNKTSSIPPQSDKKDSKTGKRMLQPEPLLLFKSRLCWVLAQKSIFKKKKKEEKCI